MKWRIASREPVGIGVHGRGRDRQDARALAPAHHAVIGLAAAKGGHSLEIDHRVESLFRQRIVFLDHERVCCTTS